MARATLLIAARNRAEQFRLAMQTILARNYEDLDIIVIDDASSDDTAQVAATYSRIINYHRLDRKGGYRRNPSEVLNIGHALAKTDIVIEQGAEVCHLTDCVTPLIEKCVPGTVALARVYNGKPEVFAKVADGINRGLVLQKEDYVPETIRTDGDRWPVPLVDLTAMRNGGIDLYCGLERAVPFLFLGAIHKYDFDAVGGYNAALPGRNDEDLANRLLAQGTRFVFSGQALAFHLLHGKS